MSMKKLLIMGLSVLFLLGWISCARDKEFYENTLKGMEKAEYRDEKLSQKRIEEIKKGIKKYQKEVEKKVEATGQIGIYYKMLAVRYMEAEMYLEAYESLKEALAIYPENPILFYLSGINAARLYKSGVEKEEKDLWLEKAEALYRRALELDPVYVDALYGLAVFLTFEKTELEETVSLLNKILSLEKKNIEAMFLLGNVYYRLGHLEEAIETYDRIAATTGAAERRKEAKANKKRIVEELYGAR